MTNKPYNFQQQLAIGAKGEAFLDGFFAPTYVITPATVAEQRQGIDRHFCNRSSRDTKDVEYKTDGVAQTTHNAFVETVSVDRTNKSGWAYTSRAEILIYYILGDELIYVIEMGALRRQLPRWEAQYPTKPALNEGYKTLGLCVALHEFERIARAVYSP